MLKLRKILLCDIFFIIIFLLSLFIAFLRIKLKNPYLYKENTTIFKGKIISSRIKDNYLELIIKGKEKLLIRFESDKKDLEKAFYKLNLNDTISVKGSLIEIKELHNPNEFSYRKYLKHHNIYQVVSSESIKLIKRNHILIYIIKDKLIKYLYHLPNKDYILAFTVGINNIDREKRNIYQEIGISHLFAISGMHIGIITTFLMYLGKHFKLEENKEEIIISLTIIFYLFLSSFTPSLLRSGMFFIFLAINNIYYFYIKPINTYLLSISFILLINPDIIFNLGFLYSALISFFLILNSKILEDKPLYALFMTTLIANIASLPLTIYYNFEINIIALLSNLFFVPFISFLLYPLCLVNIIIKLPHLTCFFINLSQKVALFFNTLKISIIIPKPPLVFIYLYYLLILLLFLTKYKKTVLISLLFLLIINLNINNFNSNYLEMMNVEQGDSFLFKINHKIILIDTGNKLNQKYDYLIYSFKSIGIKKIDYLILSHGDYDHMGEAINLVSNIKTEKVIFNCGSYNHLEKELIKVLDKKKIKYYSCIKELNIDNNKLYFLNTKLYNNENDNSSVIYTELNGYKFLFMGDAGIEKEKDILVKYNLKDIDFLKVGHHGSNTSSSKKFIDSINPKFSLISVGKNNRYNHPNKEVLNNLKNSRIYRTDNNGSIKIIIKNNKLKIKTFVK